MKMNQAIRAVAVAGLFSIALLATGCGSGAGSPVKESLAATTDAAAPRAALDKAAASAEDDESYYTPFKKPDGSRFRIAIMQSGEYFSYADVLEGTLKGLMTIGWIREVPSLLPGFAGYAAYKDGKTVPNILAELAKNDYSDYLEFPEQAFFDLKWNDVNAKSR
jgi:hypothetical protein